MICIVYVYMYVYMYIYIYIYLERDRYACVCVYISIATQPRAEQACRRAAEAISAVLSSARPAASLPLHKIRKCTSKGI